MENPSLKERLFEEIKNQKESKITFVSLVSRLLDSQRQVHIFHLQTKSFAEHKALQDYYDAIGDIVDALVESAQGKYGILTGWKSFETMEYESTEQCVSYFKTLLNDIASAYNIVKDTYIQNQLDEVTALINSTLYKLRFLK
jgi:HD superfamily phosphodiesterase